MTSRLGDRVPISVFLMRALRARIGRLAVPLYRCGERKGLVYVRVQQITRLHRRAGAARGRARVGRRAGTTRHAAFKRKFLYAVAVSYTHLTLPTKA